MKTRWRIAQFFEAWWWERYLSKKPVEEYLDWKKDYWVAFFQKEKITVSAIEKILDAGCGPAGVYMMFSENEVVAIDPLLDKYQAQLPHFQEKNNPNVYFKKIALEQFDIKNYFDKAFCLNAINHVGDLEKSMENLCTSVKNGGTLYLSVDAHNFALLKNIFRMIPGDILHPQQLDLEKYKSLLKKNGMEISRVSLIKKELIFNYYLLTAQKLKIH